MPIKFREVQSLTQAMRVALARGILPTSLSTAELRELLTDDLKRNAVFSARTANAAYLTELRKIIARLLQGGLGNDLPKLRLELKEMLRRLGYTPETGFPGDEDLGIPPAEPGSLQDLSSDARLNLILRTQHDLMTGAAQKARGNDGTRQQQFPAWELVRIEGRRVPRDWQERWLVAGGMVLRDDAGRIRLAGLKWDHRLWRELGSSANFNDALDVDYPPFAFNSGMGWRELHWTEWSRLKGADELPAERATDPQPVEIPPPVVSTKSLDPDVIKAIKDKVKDVTQKGSLLTYKQDILDRIRREREAAVQALKRANEEGSR